MDHVELLRPPGIRASCTGHSALDARIESPCAENQQGPFSRALGGSQARRPCCTAFRHWRDLASNHPSKSFQFSLARWRGDCPLRARRGPMLKIQRKANGDIVLTLSGRLEADNLSELSTVAAERAGQALVLDPRTSSSSRAARSTCVV